MTDLETRLRDDLARRAEMVNPSPALDARVERLLAVPSRHRRSPVVLAAAAVVLAAMLIAGTLLVANLDRGTEEDVVTTDPPTTEASWRELLPPPLDPRSGFTAVVATDDEVIVLGGALPNGEPVGGAALNLVTDTWRTIAPSPIEGRYFSGTTVWTGEEVLLVGGTRPPRAPEPGFEPVLLAYHPGLDQWRLPDRPSEPVLERIALSQSSNYHPLVHWTGETLAVWLPDGAVWTYEAATEHWEEITRFPAPEGSVVFAGPSLFRSEALEGRRTVAEHPMDRLDLRTGEATAIADGPPPDPQETRRLFVAGDDLIVVTGDKVWAHPLDGDGWRRLPDAPEELDLSVPGYQTGSHVLVLGGPEQPRRPIDVARFYDPLSGEIAEVRGFNVGGRGHDYVVWTGHEAVLVHNSIVPGSNWVVIAFTPPT
jgi:hypothetical protein